MRHRTFRSAAVLAVVAFLASTAIAFADSVPADTDLVTPGVQATIALGQRAPGEVVHVNVPLRLTCSSTAHVAAGSVITLTMVPTVPDDGAASANTTTIGPVPATWPSGSAPCPTPIPTLATNDPIDLVLTMPTTTGFHSFSLMWNKTSLAGLTGFTVLTVTATVVGNTAPTLLMPASAAVEGNTLGGAIVTYLSGATDLEDDPDPTPTCSPASGALFPVGTTTVNCSVIDSGGLTTNGSFSIMVGDNTAPLLVLPGDMTEEAQGPAGTAIAFTPSAMDIVDGSLPVACDHASGETFGLGTTTVACSATDAAGNPASGSFKVTIVDTTAPSLTGMPSNQSLTTANPAGATLTYAMPGATDTVDATPDVACAPASGAAIPVGDTTVTCTATDNTGNTASAAFTVSVAYVSPVRYTVVWGEPVGGSPSALVANQGRTVPVKLQVFADGAEQGTGSAVLRVDACGGGTAASIPLAWATGRWDGHLDTSSLAVGCYVATASLDGHDTGSFALDLRGAAAAPLAKGSRR
jgi:hypothetical protein